ncbi:hypothetical protein KIPB_008622 [Kipferlia bialata]|uniref:Uncharacterized protein n=1 Tax=Kipferlia bialata TaxID=797122 RepID=A0A9K3D3M9_9EUKA|nr:hypothetical protein KIPB_008622 [Kipferlia bialata]|eukprot:g8622.t1
MEGRKTLQNTHALDELGDHLGVQPQHKPVTHQEERCAVFERENANLREAHNRLSGEVASLTSTISDLRQGLGEQEKLREAADERAVEAEASAEALRQSLSTLAAQLQTDQIVGAQVAEAQWMPRLSTLEAEIGVYRRRLAEAEERQERQAAETLTCQAKVQRLQSELDTVNDPEGELGGLRDLVRKQRKKIAALESELSGAGVSKTEYADLSAMYNAETQRLRHSLAISEQKNATVMREVSSLVASVQKALKSIGANLDKQRKKHKAEMRDLKDKLKKTQRRERQYHADYTSLHQSINKVFG